MLPEVLPLGVSLYDEPEQDCSLAPTGSFCFVLLADDARGELEIDQQLQEGDLVVDLVGTFVTLIFPDCPRQPFPPPVDRLPDTDGLGES